MPLAATVRDDAGVEKRPKAKTDDRQQPNPITAPKSADKPETDGEKSVSGTAPIVAQGSDGKLYLNVQPPIYMTLISFKFKTLRRQAKYLLDPLLRILSRVEK